MKNWFNRNYKAIIISAFLIPIITVALVSISHVTKWYGISNPFTWAVYLSIGIEIAALSALAAISADMGKKVYFPFGIVTLIQFIGNIYFAYSFIDINSAEFKQWVELVSPLLEFTGIESTDYVSHKRFLAFFAGGMLPIISLSFLHMLVKFTQDNKETPTQPIINEPINEGKSESPIQEPTEVNSDELKVTLTERDLEILEKILSNPPKPNENLVNAMKKYKEEVETPIVTMTPTETPIVTPTVEVYPALSDEEIYKMNMDEWERRYDDDEEIDDIPEIEENQIDLNKVAELLKDRELFPESNQRAKEIIENSNIEEVLNVIENEEIIPTEEEENENFSTITPTEAEEFSTKEEENENIFQEDYEGQSEEWLNETVSLPFATPEELEISNVDVSPEPTPTETPNEELEVTVEQVNDEPQTTIEEIVEEQTNETPNDDELPKDQPEEEKKNP